MSGFSVPLGPPDEEWLKPSPRLASMRRVQVFGAAATAALAIIALAIAAQLAGARGILPSAGLALVGTAAGALALDRFAQRRIRFWGYAERDEDLLVRRGVLVQRLSVIPYGRMQFIDVVAGPVERVFGLATVRMHTAAAASDARIPGLAKEEAARLRDRLASLGEAKAAGL